MELTIPDPSLVVLVGPSGAGKSTFAAACFRPTEVLSPDALRGFLTNDPTDQRASGEAFVILSQLLHGRLKRRLLTVVDATNLKRATRRRWLTVAMRYEIPTVAIVFDLSERLFLAHNELRPDRRVDREVVLLQASLLRRSVAAIPSEGFSRLYVFREPLRVADVRLERVRPPPGRPRDSTA